MSNIIKALIVDDSLDAIKALKQDVQLLFSDTIQLVGEAQTIDEGKILFKETVPDLIFLDIDLKNGTGFDFLKQISAYNHTNYQVIFTTAFNQFAIKAIKFSAFDYLLKPIDIDELEDSVNRFIGYKKDSLTFNAKKSFEVITNYKNDTKSSAKRIAIPATDQICYREIHDVVRCQSEHNYTHIYLISGEHFFVSKTIKEYESILSEHNFLRVHQSHLVNLSYVSSFLKEDNGILQLKNGVKIPVSRRNKEKVLMRLNLL